MKKILTLICALATIALIPINPVLAVAGGALAAASLALGPQAGCADATLILPMLTGKVMDAFFAEVPELTYFSTDFGLTNGDFAQPAKFNQEVISHLAQIPTVHDYDPTTDKIFTDASRQKAKDLVVDVKVKIDTAKIVRVSVPQGDATQLLISPAFMQSLVEAGRALGRAVVTAALDQVTIANFSHELVAPNESITDSITDSTKWSQLGESRVQLNKQFAKQPRYIIAGSDWVAPLGADLRVSSSLGYNQRTTTDPYARYQNLEGFNEIREFTEMPTTDNLVGFAFEKRAIHLAVRQLTDGFDLAKQLGIPTNATRNAEVDPKTGLSLTAWMYYDPDLSEVIAAFIAAFGIRAGRSIINPDDPGSVDADAGMDRCGLRLVSASNS